MVKEKFGTIKKFGARYGRTVKKRFGSIEKLQKAKYICPVCGYQKVKRLAVGIWQCEKCQNKFTSKAYTVSKLPKLKTQTED